MRLVALLAFLLVYLASLRARSQSTRRSLERRPSFGRLSEINVAVLRAIGGGSNITQECRAVLVRAWPCVTRSVQRTHAVAADESELCLSLSLCSHDDLSSFCAECRQPLLKAVESCDLFPERWRTMLYEVPCLRNSRTASFCYTHAEVRLLDDLAVDTAFDIGAQVCATVSPHITSSAAQTLSSLSQPLPARTCIDLFLYDTLPTTTSSGTEAALLQTLFQYGCARQRLSTVACDASKFAHAVARRRMNALGWVDTSVADMLRVYSALCGDGACFAARAQALVSAFVESEISRHTPRPSLRFVNETDENNSTVLEVTPALPLVMSVQERSEILHRAERAARRLVRQNFDCARQFHASSTSTASGSVNLPGARSSVPSQLNIDTAREEGTAVPESSENTLSADIFADLVLRSVAGVSGLIFDFCGQFLEFALPLRELIRCALEFEDNPNDEFLVNAAANTRKLSCTALHRLFVTNAPPLGCCGVGILHRELTQTQQSTLNDFLTQNDEGRRAVEQLRLLETDLDTCAIFRKRRFRVDFELTLSGLSLADARFGPLRVRDAATGQALFESNGVLLLHDLVLLDLAVAGVVDALRAASSLTMPALKVTNVNLTELVVGGTQDEALRQALLHPLSDTFVTSVEDADTTDDQLELRVQLLFASFDNLLVAYQRITESEDAFDFANVNAVFQTEEAKRIRVVPDRSSFSVSFAGD
ncbi:MAG: hypothetical protein MHM6MM_002589 [Cercozoa sp. M6MM]